MRIVQIITFGSCSLDERCSLHVSFQSTIRGILLAKWLCLHSNTSCGGSPNPMRMKQTSAICVRDVTPSRHCVKLRPLHAECMMSTTRPKPRVDLCHQLHAKYICLMIPVNVPAAFFLANLQTKHPALRAQHIRNLYLITAVESALPPLQVLMSRNFVDLNLRCLGPFVTMRKTGFSVYSAQRRSSQQHGYKFTDYV